MTISVSANNGQAPASALTAMPGRNGDGSQQMSPLSTAASYSRMRASMQAAGMGDLLPTSGWSCYRDRAAQQHMRNIGLTTIPVGQSIHGEWTWGSAVDFANLGGFGAARHNWLRNNAAGFGWYQPGWAQQNGSLPEPWHWEYDQRGDPHDGEEDVGLTPDEAQRLANIEGAVGRLETLYGADSGRVTRFDETADRAVDTTNAVGRVETNQNDLLAQLPAATYGSTRIASLALVVAVAVLVALGVDLSTGVENDAVYGGGGTLLGGLLAWVMLEINPRQAKHRRTDNE